MYVVRRPALSSGEEPASPRHRAASRRWRGGRRTISTNALVRFRTGRAVVSCSATGLSGAAGPTSSRCWPAARAILGRRRPRRARPRARAPGAGAALRGDAAGLAGRSRATAPRGAGVLAGADCAAAAIARAAAADRARAGEALDACVAVLDALARTSPQAARATFAAGRGTRTPRRGRGDGRSPPLAPGHDGRARGRRRGRRRRRRAALARTVAVAAAGSRADAVLDALVAAAAVDAVLGGAAARDAARTPRRPPARPARPRWARRPGPATPRC